MVRGSPRCPGRWCAHRWRALAAHPQTASGTTTEWGTPTKSLVGNVDNTADAEKPLSTAVADALSGKASTQAVALKADKTDLDLKANDADLQELANAKVDNIAVGAASGVAPLDDAAKVPDVNLPARLGEAALTSTTRKPISPCPPPRPSWGLAPLPHRL